MLQMFTFSLKPTSLFLEKGGSSLWVRTKEEKGEENIYEENLHLLRDLRISENNSQDRWAKEIYKACIARIEEIIRANPKQTIVQRQILKEILNRWQQSDVNMNSSNISTREVPTSDISLKRAQGVLWLFDILPELPQHIDTIKSIISWDSKVISMLVHDINPESRKKSHQLLVLANIIKSHLEKSGKSPVGGYRYMNSHRDRLQRNITNFINSSIREKTLDAFSEISELYITDLYRIELWIHETKLPLPESITTHEASIPESGLINTYESSNFIPHLFNISELEQGQKLAITYVKDHNENWEVISNGFIKIEEYTRSTDGKITIKISHDNEEGKVIFIDENIMLERWKSVNFPEIWVVFISKMELLKRFEKNNTRDSNNIPKLNTKDIWETNTSNLRETNTEKEKSSTTWERQWIISSVKTVARKAWGGVRKLLWI